MTIYSIFHRYTTDGEDSGFVNPIVHMEQIASFENKDDANAFVKQFEKPHVYDGSPYVSNDLECGTLVVKEVNIISHSEYDPARINTDSFWWLSPDSYYEEE